ncbi:MAG: hypothetical protein ABL878_03380 [Burkholderiales bacterium]
MFWKLSGLALRCIGCLAALWIPGGVAAQGTLETFEREVLAPRASVPAPAAETHFVHSGRLNGFDLFLNMVFGIYADSESPGFSNDTDLTHLNAAPREPGDPQMSYIRLDAGYQNLRSDVLAADGGLEIGFRNYALHHRSTRFKESRPDDILRMQQTHFLWRATTQPGVEADFGLGHVSLEGNQRSSGLSATVPIRWKVQEWVHVELRAAWAEVNGHGLSDYDLAIGLLGRFAGVRLGYRYIDAHNVPALQGPYVGLSFYY